MAEADSSAVDIDDVGADSQFHHAGDRLTGECFVDLPAVDVFDREVGVLEGEAAARDWSCCHYRWVEADDAPRDDAGERFVAVGSCSARRFDDDRCGSIDHS